MSAENKWSIVNTVLLATLTLIGALVARYMNTLEGRLDGVVRDISEINQQIQSLKSDRDFEKGRMQGIKEALEAQSTMEK